MHDQSRDNVVTVVTLPKLNYIFNIKLIRHPILFSYRTYFEEIDKCMLKCIWKLKVDKLTFN